jgi:hypothetical protein
MFDFIKTYLYCEAMNAYNLIVCFLTNNWDISKRNVYLEKLFDVKYTGNTFADILPTTKAILSNHKCFADCVLDNTILCWNGTYLSRQLVFLLIPFTATYAYFTRQVNSFNRINSNKKQIERIVQTVCCEWNKILLFYPEGMRNQTDKPLPLKYGVIKRLYLKKIPLQIMNTSNKDKVFNEKKMIFNKGITCNVVISKQYDPLCYDNLETFIDDITAEFNRIYLSNKPIS